MNGEPFGPARGYGFLVHSAVADTYRAVDVMKVQPDADAPTSNGSYVPLFRTVACADRWIADQLRYGMRLKPIAAPSAHALTDLLTDLRSIGVTHVAVDPDPGRPDLIPVERAIIGFGLQD